MNSPKKVITEGQLRGLIRKLVREYVADTDGDPHKEKHADPTGRNWDAGLDEAQGPATPPPMGEQPVEMNPDLDEADDDHSDPSARDWDSG